MALVVADRVKETTTTTGTGTVTLLGAAAGFQSFAVLGNASTTYYTIADQNGGSNWEVGIGTYTLSGTTLSRDTILSSSNSDSVVNFAGGTKDVFVTYPSSRTVVAPVMSQNSQSAAYTLVYSDAGKHLLHPSSDTTARTFTVPANSSVPYNIGTSILFVNQRNAGTLTISTNTDSMYLAAATTPVNGSYALNYSGVATALKITSTEWIISGQGVLCVFNIGITISANTLDYNIRNAAIAAGWDGVGFLNFTLTINAGIYVGSTTTATPAITTGGSYPKGSQITINNNGGILGRGGNGGGGGGGAAGGGGGLALFAGFPLIVNNVGTIGGGGNGGAAGSGYGLGGGGGGGAGYNVGTGGAGGGNAGAGTAGTNSAGGAGGGGGSTCISSNQYGCTAYGYGSAGATGGGLGGGAATSGSTTYITWVATGTRYGTVG
jgi:hypothetical protein